MANKKVVASGGLSKYPAAKKTGKFGTNPKVSSSKKPTMNKKVVSGNMMKGKKA